MLRVGSEEDEADKGMAGADDDTGGKTTVGVSRLKDSSNSSFDCVLIGAGPAAGELSGDPLGVGFWGAG